MPRKYSRTPSRATSYIKEKRQLAMQKIKNNELTYAAASIDHQKCTAYLHPHSAEVIKNLI